VEIFGAFPRRFGEEPYILSLPFYSICIRTLSESLYYVFVLNVIKEIIGEFKFK
jgi:hypothetical protein